MRWEKMSKRKGNVVNPDDIIDQYGVDALRVYLCFLTPLESDKPWQTSQLEAQFDWLMNINFWGVVHGCRAFMPQLQARASRQEDAVIVNISSIFGLVASPGQAEPLPARDGTSTRRLSRAANNFSNHRLVR